MGEIADDCFDYAEEDLDRIYSLHDAIDDYINQQELLAEKERIEELHRYSREGECIADCRACRILHCDNKL